jgi:hypothetical protein
MTAAPPASRRIEALKRARVVVFGVLALLAVLYLAGRFMFLSEMSIAEYPTAKAARADPAFEPGSLAALIPKSALNIRYARNTSSGFVWIRLDAPAKEVRRMLGGMAPQSGRVAVSRPWGVDWWFLTLAPEGQTEHISLPDTPAGPEVYARGCAPDDQGFFRCTDYAAIDAPAATAYLWFMPIR